MLRLAFALLVLGALPAAAQVTAANPIPPGSDTLLLPEVRMRDVAILPQPETGVYTGELFPEQWRNWRPRVVRGSQVLVCESPLGPFTAFESHSTLPVDMMTLDGTLWKEDGVLYMVFAHEWVQIKDGIRPFAG